jgi:hypothetical protein
VTAADVLPEFHFRERHSIAVAAPAERALAAAKETRVADIPVLNVLITLRGMRRVPGGSLWDAMTATSFRQEGDDTLVAVGKPWLPRGGMRVAVHDFAAFDEPGYAKMAVDLRFADGRLTTETRIFLTSPEAGRRFRAYWLVIRPFSGLTRRLWLRAAKRRAET